MPDVLHRGNHREQGTTNPANQVSRIGVKSKLFRLNALDRVKTAGSWDTGYRLSRKLTTADKKKRKQNRDALKSTLPTNSKSLLQLRLWTNLGKRQGGRNTRKGGEFVQSSRLRKRSPFTSWTGGREVKEKLIAQGGLR